MIIYIEGVDGSGKTTLARALAKRLETLSKLNGIKVEPDGETMISTKPWQEDRITADALVDNLLKMSKDTTTVYIVDRGPLSDIIYRTFDDGKYSPVLNLEQFLYVWLANSRGFIVVHCDSALSEELMHERGDDNEVSIKEHRKLRYLFQQIMPLFSAKVFDVKRAISKERVYTQMVVNEILAVLWQHQQALKTLELLEQTKEV